MIVDVVCSCQVLGRVLRDNGFDADALLRRAGDEDVKAKLKDTTSRYVMTCRHSPVSTVLYFLGRGSHTIFPLMHCNVFADVSRQWSFLVIFVAADLAEMLPPVNFVVARRCRRRVKSRCAAFSFKKFLCISPRAPSSFLYLFLFRFLLRLTSFFLLHEKTMVCLTNLKEKKNSKS